MSTADNNTQQKNSKLNSALIRCVSSLLLAVLLLSVTGFAVISLLKGPRESADIQTDQPGDFVYREIFSILGFYAEDATEDRVHGLYGLVPMGGKLVTVHFTERYLQSAEAVCDNTYSYINGDISTLNKYISVQGTVGTLTEAQSALMYDWFTLNKGQLVEMGVIGDTDDYADYLTDTALFVDTVHGYNQTTVIVLSVIAGIFLLCMAVELYLMGSGFYLPGRRNKKSETDTSPESGEPETKDDLTEAENEL